METKRLILVMLLGMMVIVAWPRVMNFVGQKAGWDMTPKAPIADTSNDTAAVTPDASTDASTGNAQATSLPGGPTTGSTTATTSASHPALIAGWSVVQATPTTQAVAGADSNGTISIGSDAKEDPNYALQLTIAARGAGLDHASLNDYQLVLSSPDRFTFERPMPGFADQTRPLAIRGVTIDGTDIDLTYRDWTLVPSPADASGESQSATYSLVLARAGKPSVELRRTWTVFKRDAEKWEANGKTYAPLGYEPKVVTSVKNFGDAPLAMTLRFNAPSVPPSESERFVDAQYITGYAASNVVAPDSPHTSDGIKDPVDLLATRKDRQPYWFGTSTTYFMSLFRFDPKGGTNVPIDRFGAINARTLTPNLTGAQRANELVIVTKPFTVSPGDEGAIAGHVYLGPKKREVLTNDYYAAPWIQYDRGLVITNWFCGFCTWQWLINILFAILTAFHAVTRDWGLSIIGLTFLVRLILHPVTKRAQLNMLKFGKLAPEMERIKKKHADDQEEMNRQMMAFYREHGGTQLMGCLPMFLQMPVWIALWQAMNTTFELRHQPLLYGLTWIHDLSKPDHLIDFAAHGWPAIHLPLLSFVVISGVNVLPFIYGFLQYFQFKIQPKPPTMTPEQEQQQKTMQRMMLFMMPVILYASPSGLMIYMITSFTLGIIESKVVKKQFATMTANEARFEIIDDDAPRPANVQKATVRRKADEPKKKGLFGMLSEARERAVEMQREMEKQRKKRS